MIYFSPFSNKYSLYSSIVAEGSFFVFTILLYSVIKPRTDSKNSFISWAGITIICVALVASWVFVILQQLETWKEKKAISANKVKLKNAFGSKTVKNKIRTNTKKKQKVKTKIEPPRSIYNKEDKNKKSVKKEVKARRTKLNNTKRSKSKSNSKKLPSIKEVSKL